MLRRLGIGLPAFQIDGGLLLLVSYRMIFGDRPQKEVRETGKARSEHASDAAVFPLAIPLMAVRERSRPFCCSPATLCRSSGCSC